MATILDTLVFDRTQADVDRVIELKSKWLNGTITQAERTEFIAGLKGAYNNTDLNRVGEATQYVADLLNMFGFTVTIQTPKTNWQRSDIPSQEQANTYLSNLNAVQQADGTTIGTDTLPITLNNLTYTDANNIEKMLYDVGFKYANSTSGFKHLSFNLGRPHIGTRG